MSTFYATITSDKLKTPKTGGGNRELTTTTAGWGGAVRVSLLPGKNKGEPDQVIIMFVPWQGAGKSRLLYAGPLAPEDHDLAKHFSDGVSRLIQSYLTHPKGG